MNYLILFLLFVFSCSPGNENSIEIRDAWIREVPAGSERAALYFEVINGGSGEDRVVSVDTTLSERTEIHSTNIDSKGLATMEKLEEVVVPSGESVVFAPGGTHVMLIGLNKKIKAGEEYQIKVNFKNSGNKTATARVKKGL